MARTAHFALHRIALPAPPGTIGATLFAAGDTWIGALVPKRWARRAVRRNLIRRQIHALAALPELARSATLIRLRTAYARDAFPSARSAALKRTVRAELRQLLVKTR